ncbi:hypothetical protein M9Y10_018811 [Tritrichomonas musculus]|uniref:EGF-like domain-containing protein n=1 Tax=Tritrichomonas musculus TaxID=1915356 RepID=A0ABR2HHY8_9EUKA
MNIILIFLLFPFIQNACDKFTGCDQCTKDETQCTKCQSLGMTTYIDLEYDSITYGQCILCPLNCQSCGPSGCTSCDEKFGLNEKGECVRCEDHRCKDCSSNYKYCNKCRVDPVNNGKCEDCVDENCLSCSYNMSECEVCRPGFEVNINKVCEPTTKLCKITTEDEETCTECINEYYLDGNNQCQKCPDNCNKCDESKCIECSPLYGLNENGKCINCEDPLCAYCSENYKICTICRNVLIFKVSSNGRCEYDCPDRNCINGDCLHSNSSQCYQCKEGFYLNNDKQCIKCEVENCKDCHESVDKCYKCKDGYHLSSSETSCDPYDNPICNDNSCSKCVEGYVLSNGECKQCQDENCLKCKKDTVICQECKKGFNFLLEKNSKDHGKCVPCTDKNCIECRYSIDFCTNCKYGYIRSDGSCITKKQYLIDEGLIAPGDDYEDDPDDGNDDENTNGNNNNNTGKNDDKKSKLSKGAIIGIAVGCAAAVIIIVTVIVVYFAVCKKKKVGRESSSP